MIDDKLMKKVKIVVTCLIIVFLIWFLLLSPLLKFKGNEKQLLEGAERYYELNPNKLPTGEKIVKVSLQTLYDKDFVQTDLEGVYTSQSCNTEASWVKVKKEDGEYKYYPYLECGVFKSLVDHKGPTIKLNGKEEVTIDRGDTYKEQGVASVVDNKDGKIDNSKVVIDTSKVDTSKVGTYDVTYKVKDSFLNETVVVRKVKVVQTVNSIVQKGTDSSNVYKGLNDNTYIKIDGILFNFVGINSDSSVKVVSSEALAAVDFEGLDSWLNDYFYTKLSDDTKKVIQSSKWCNEEVNDASKYTKCSSTGKKANVGLLSIADYNNSKDSDGIYYLTESSSVWTSNIKGKNEAWVKSYINSSNVTNEYGSVNVEQIISVKPALNIVKNTPVVDGDGSISNPYILEVNKNNSKAGDKISTAKTGSYINYSGYLWRVIGSAEDKTTNIIMLSVASTSTDTYYTLYDTKASSYNPTSKTNLGYKISNEVPNYINTSYFETKKINIKSYKDKVLYNKNDGAKTYSLKLAAVSVFDLYSSNDDNNSTAWFREGLSSKQSAFIKAAIFPAKIVDYNDNDLHSVRVSAYLKNSVVIKNGTGTKEDPYTLTK